MKPKETRYLISNLALSVETYKKVKNRPHNDAEIYYLKAIINNYIDLLERFKCERDDYRRIIENVTEIYSRV